MQSRDKYLLSACITLSAIFANSTALAEPPGKHWLNVGDTVQIDKLQASTPAGAIWATGKIVEVKRSSNSYLVEVDGVRMTIINKDEWIKPSAGEQQNQGNPGNNQGNTAQAAPPNTAGNNFNQQSGGGKGNFKIGDIVSVDKIMASTAAGAMWSSGKVVSVNNDRNSITVLTPDGVERTIVNNKDWIRQGGTDFQAPAAQAPNPGAQAGAAQPNPDTAARGKQQPPARGPGVPEWERRKGLGAPPSGQYVVNKFGGGAGLDIGTLTIRGNSYSGIVRGGSNFAPFTMEGDHIVWTNGLEGLPAGTSLVASKYIGSDERGRALVRIWYRGTRGALEVLDAYRISQ